MGQGSAVRADPGATEPRPADKSTLDHRRKAGPSRLSPTAEAWGGPQGKEGEATPLSTRH